MSKAKKSEPKEKTIEEIIAALRKFGIPDDELQPQERIADTIAMWRISHHADWRSTVNSSRFNAIPLEARTRYYSDFEAVNEYNPADYLGMLDRKIEMVRTLWTTCYPQEPILRIVITKTGELQLMSQESAADFHYRLKARLKVKERSEYNKKHKAERAQKRVDAQLKKLNDEIEALKVAKEKLATKAKVS